MECSSRSFDNHGTQGDEHGATLVAAGPVELGASEDCPLGSAEASSTYTKTTPSQ